MYYLVLPIICENTIGNFWSICLGVHIWFSGNLVDGSGNIPYLKALKTFSLPLWFMLSEVLVLCVVLLSSFIKSNRF